MRILVARCEIAYQGRAATRLGAGERVILFKADGSLCVHAERGFKPLNYMPGPTSVREEGDTIRVYRAASDETLVIILHHVLSDETLPLVDDAVLERVEQLPRYCERVDLDAAHRPCRGMLVAPEIAPQARVMCEARGFDFVAVDYEALRGDAVPELTLFE